MTDSTYHDFLQAARHGNLKKLKKLLPLVDPKACDSEVLRWAAIHGHVEMVKFLLPLCDPKADESSPLTCATECGHVEIVRLLIPVSDPEAQNNMALLTAVIRGLTTVDIFVYFPLKSST